MLAFLTFLHEIRQNNWRRLRNKSTTFRERYQDSDQSGNLDSNPGSVFQPNFMGFRGALDIGEHTRSLVVFAVLIYLSI